MDQKLTSSLSSHRPKVVAIVAAYNEGPRIRKIIEVLSSYPGFDEVVVIDDGSTDNTFLEIMAARDYRRCVVMTQQNRGKGKAMDLGVQHSQPDVIFFCDADVVGLTHEIINQTLEPVLTGEVGMMIAMRDRPIYSVRFAIKMAALLGGERALTRELWDSIDEEFKDGFMIETALNYVADRSSNFSYKIFPGLSQVIKEKKHGVFVGFVGRIRMIMHIVWAHILLRLPK